MFDLRLGTELREFISHEWNITDIKLIEFKGQKQLFSSSLDGSIKMWETKKSSRTVTKVRFPTTFDPIFVHPRISVAKKNCVADGTLV